MKILISGGHTVSGFPKDFALIASYKVLNVPIIIIISFLVLIIFDILLRKNIFFRLSFIIGGYEYAAFLFDVRVRMIKMVFYIMVSTMSAVGGILLASRLSAAYLESGINTPFTVIAAVVIGGASLKGGRGSVTGSFLGLILLSLLTQMLVFFKVNMLYERVLMGLILIFVVVIDSIINRRSIMLSA